MRNILIIFKKELKDMLRDRRTIFFMIVFPLILMPLLMTAVPKLFSDSKEKQQNKILNVAFIGEKYSNELYQQFLVDESFLLHTEIDENDIEQLILDDSIQVAIVISNEFINNIETMNPAKVLIYHRSSDDMDVTQRRINKVFNNYATDVRNIRFEKLDIDKDVVNPLDISFHNYASGREQFGKMVGGFLPYLFVIFCFMGAMYPALDLGAGEKERGTLETLLVSPANRMEIMLGKFGVVTLSGFVSVGLGFTGIYFVITRLTSSNEASQILEILTSIVQPGTIALVLSLIIPVAVFFSAILLSISIYAKTFKEAQSIIGPLNILFFVPVIVGLVPGIKLDVVTALIPILNISLATKEVIAGTVNYWLLSEVYVAMFLLAFASIYFATKWFNKENVIFRT